jgi:hypothetical protein
VEFVVAKMAMGQVFLPDLRFFPDDIIPPWFSIFIYYSGMNNRPVGGCSSEIQSHPFNINTNNNSIMFRANIIKRPIILMGAVFYQHHLSQMSSSAFYSHTLPMFVLTLD